MLYHMLCEITETIPVPWSKDAVACVFRLVLVHHFLRRVEQQKLRRFRQFFSSIGILETGDLVEALAVGEKIILSPHSTPTLLALYHSTDSLVLQACRSPTFVLLTSHVEQR